MPLFDFRCTECREVFEAICRSSADADVVCPSCGAGAPSRLISRFAIGHEFTPCGTPRSEASSSCAMNARNGGCSMCE